MASGRILKFYTIVKTFKYFQAFGEYFMSRKAGIWKEFVFLHGFAKIWGLTLWANVEWMVEGCGKDFGRIVEGG